jgi:hypothetical protein
MTSLHSDDVAVNQARVHVVEKLHTGFVVLDGSSTDGGGGEVMAAALSLDACAVTFSAAPNAPRHTITVCAAPTRPRGSTRPHRATVSAGREIGKGKGTIMRQGGSEYTGAFHSERTVAGASHEGKTVGAPPGGKRMQEHAESLVEPAEIKRPRLM